MEIARIQVSGVQARAVRKMPAIPAKLVGGYITLEYTDSLWEGLTKTVVFRSYVAIGSLDDRSEVVTDVVTNDTIIKVPPEVLEKPGRTLAVGFYGTRTDGTIAIPTFYAKINEVREAADPSGDESTNPTLPVYAQLAERVEALEKGGGGSGGVGPQGPQGEPGPAGPQGPQGEPGYTPAKYVDYWTKEDKAEMVSDVLAALPVWEGGSY